MNRVCVARSLRRRTFSRFNAERGKVAAAYPQNGVAIRRAAAIVAAEIAAAGTTPTARAEQHDTSLVVQHFPAVPWVYDYFATGRFCVSLCVLCAFVCTTRRCGENTVLCAHACVPCVYVDVRCCCLRGESPEQPIRRDLRCLAHSALLYKLDCHG